MVQWDYARFILMDFQRTSSVTDMLKELNSATLQESRAQQRVCMVYCITCGLIDIPKSRFTTVNRPSTRGNPEKFKIPFPLPMYRLAEYDWVQREANEACSARRQFKISNYSIAHPHLVIQRIRYRMGVQREALVSVPQTHSSRTLDFN